MSDAARRRDRLRKIAALLAGAGPAGARLAAAAALERMRARLSEATRRDPPIELKVALPDAWSRQLFLALARRYGLAPYRYRKQRTTTVMLRVPRSFVDEVLWPEFKELNKALQSYLGDVTARVIREQVHGDVSEAAEIAGELPAPP
jgi:hypothetical protein